MAAATNPDAVEQAREAASRGDLEEAFDQIAAADAAGLVKAADLPLLAHLAYATGHVEVTIGSWERLYAECHQRGDAIAAAGAAARVAMHLLFDTALMAPVRGWLSRAERLLEGHAETPAHAWYAVVRAYERMLGGDAEGARPWAERAVALGALDPAACAIGRVAQARLLILDGDVRRGLNLLEEVGVSTISGDLDPLSTGVVYCELVCALQGVAQYDLAEQWTQNMERWARTHAIGSLHGRCRVHRAEILRLRGAFEHAELEATAACDELRPYLRRELGWPLCELGRIRLRRGDLQGAEQALLQAHDAGWDPQPDLALLHLAKGDAATAAALIQDALERPTKVPSKERPPSSSLQRAPLLEAQVEIAIAANDLDRARAAAAELSAISERFESRALVASAALARGRVALADGDAAGAGQHLSEAVRVWSEVGAPYEAAVARMAVANAYRLAGNQPLAELEFRTARAGLDRIRSAPEKTKEPDTQGQRHADAAPETAPRYDVFRCEGDYWCVIFENQSFQIRDLKGVRYLARLLADPDRQFHVLDLVASETGASEPEKAVADTLRFHHGDAGELLDEQAKKAYQRRLAEIEEDIREAEAAVDSTRIEQARAERDFLVGELSRAFGLRGKGRRAAVASERARVGVTRALRQVIARIGGHHSSLGRHLERAIQTGTYCSYRPDPRTTERWTF